MLHGNKRIWSLISISCLTVLKAVGEINIRDSRYAAMATQALTVISSGMCMTVFKVTEALSGSLEFGWLHFELN